MTPLMVEATRGAEVESTHRVIAAVTDAEGRLVAAAGDPGHRTWWRSAAKPFQALPLVDDGAAERFQLTSLDLAIACASHSSEPAHLEAVDEFMRRTGVREEWLACGPHPPLSPEVHRRVVAEEIALTPRWSNCSGKHTGMLALARFHGWPIEEYVDPGHPVQTRLLASVASWTGLAPEAIGLGVDGCATVCYALPLAAMARAWARLGVASEPGPTRIRDAFLAHPFLIAGTGRSCTGIMSAWPGQVIVKVGAAGVYSAALPSLGLGVALKVEDGDMRASAVALVAVLEQIAARLGQAIPRFPTEALAAWITPPLRNTRNDVTGHLRLAGELDFLVPGAQRG